MDGYESVIKQGPLNEAKLIIVGEQPMISLYRLNKVIMIIVVIIIVINMREAGFPTKHAN